MAKARTLYQVRIHHADRVFGVQVGHKYRLVPLRAAKRIAARIGRAGHLVTTDKMAVTLSREQAAYLSRRYGKGA